MPQPRHGCDSSTQALGWGSMRPVRKRAGRGPSPLAGVAKTLVGATTVGGSLAHPLRLLGFGSIRGVWRHDGHARARGLPPRPPARAHGLRTAQSNSFGIERRTRLTTGALRWRRMAPCGSLGFPNANSIDTPSFFLCLKPSVNRFNSSCGRRLGRRVRVGMYMRTKRAELFLTEPSHSLPTPKHTHNQASTSLAGHQTLGRRTS